MITLSREARYRLAWAFAFAVAMGFFEAAVVVYLRELYYPDGFRFPLVPRSAMAAHVLGTEVAREAFSIVMILSVAFLAGRNRRERFGTFMFIFGVWDILYYVFLKLILGWPVSLKGVDLLDVLFLIPVPWIGPIWAPILVSLGLIGSHLVILQREDSGRPVRTTPTFWALEATAGLVVIASFVAGGPRAMAGEMPGPFPAWLFFTGYLGGIAVFVRHVLKGRRPGAERRSPTDGRPGDARGPGAERRSGTDGGPDDARGPAA